MKKCHYCNAENKDAARFCVKCGKSLEKRCTACGAPLEEEEIFCPGCGARTDGKLVCAACGEENEAGNEFCAGCGAALAAPFAQTKEAPRVEPKAKKPVKQIAVRVLDIVRASLFMAFAIVMFIMSFMSVSKITDEGALAEMKLVDTPVSVNVSPIDLMEGAFAYTDPDSLTGIMSDFTAFMSDHLSERELKVIDQDPDSMQAVAIINKVVEEYNIFRLTAAKDLVKYTPSGTMELWLTAAVGLFYILLSGAFLVASIVDFVNTLQGKKGNRKAPGIFAALLLSASLGYAFLLKMIFGGRAGYGLITILTLCLLFFLIEIGYRLFTGELRFEKGRLPAYVSTGIGAVCTIFVLFFAGATLAQVFCEYSASPTSSATNFHGGYTASSLAGAWNALKLSMDNPDMINSAGTYIPDLFKSLGASSILADSLLEEGLSPAWMGVRGLMAVENALAVLGVLLELVCIAFIVTLGLSFGNRVKALSEARDSKLVYQIVGAALALALLGLTIAYVVIVNSTMQDVEGVDYTVKVSGFLIAVVALVFADLIQKIVIRFITKKKAVNRLHDAEITAA